MASAYAVLILVTLILAVASSTLAAAAAAANDEDDGSTQTVVDGSTTLVPRDEELATSVDGRNVTDVSSAVSVDPGGGEATKRLGYWETEVSVMWFKIASPILIVMSTFGNLVSVVTLQNPLSLPQYSTSSSITVTSASPEARCTMAAPEPAVWQVFDELRAQCAGRRGRWGRLHRSSPSLDCIHVLRRHPRHVVVCVQAPPTSYLLLSPGISQAFLSGLPFNSLNIVLINSHLMEYISPTTVF